jgi:prevent-host-death family protein
MRTVNIADLKNNLSAHLERVRAGEELLVKDRNRPIARLVPLTSGEDLDAEELELAATGIVRRASFVCPPGACRIRSGRCPRRGSLSRTRSQPSHPSATKTDAFRQSLGQDCL